MCRIDSREVLPPCDVDVICISNAICCRSDIGAAVTPLLDEPGIPLGLEVAGIAFTSLSWKKK